MYIPPVLFQYALNNYVSTIPVTSLTAEAKYIGFTMNTTVTLTNSISPAATIKIGHYTYLGRPVHTSARTIALHGDTWLTTGTVLSIPMSQKTLKKKAGTPSTVTATGTVTVRPFDITVPCTPTAPSSPYVAINTQSAPSLFGVVTDTSLPPRPLSGATVGICSTVTGICTPPSPMTGTNGSYSLTTLSPGTYVAYISPPGGFSPKTSTPFTIPVTGPTHMDFALTPPLSAPPGTIVHGLGNATVGGHSVPVVFWTATVPITTLACGTATTVTATITAKNLLTGMTQAITSHLSASAHSGVVSPTTEVFHGEFSALNPLHGDGVMQITVTGCPGRPRDEPFTIYIDPSGTVVDGNHGDAPLAGATVKLLASTSMAGPFTPVPNGSPIMSPANRTNPDTTLPDGRFGWTTVPGYYEVQATKTGCGTTTSAPFEVPPPMVDLQLVLHCSSAPPPTITSLSRMSGPVAGGTQVTITGTGFSGATNVKFGTTPARSFTFKSSTQLVATSPAHAAGTVRISVTTPGGTTPTTSADLYKFVFPVPAVSSVSPASGPASGGTTVTVGGSGFTGATKVYFGTKTGTTVTVTAGGTLTVKSPVGTSGTSVNIQVVTPGGESPAVTADLFTYVPGPTITSLSRTSGPVGGGTKVTISGTGFTTVKHVKFGTTTAESYTVSSSTSIIATSPAHVAAQVRISVTTAAGTTPATSNDLYTF